MAGLFVLLILPSASAGNPPKAQADACAVDGSLCAGAPPVEAPAVPDAAQVHRAPDAGLRQIGLLIAGAAGAIGDATAQAAQATAAAVLAVGAAVMAAVRAYAGFLLSFRPARMDLVAFAGLASTATAAAAAGVQTGLWRLGRRLAPYLGALPLFSRIEKDALLEHDRRAKIFDFIQANPGAHLSEISRRLEIPWGSALHHIRKLRADRLILFKAVGHHKCFFVNGSGLSSQEMAAASVVKGQTLQQIANYIQEHPRTNLKELAQAVRITSPLAAFHVRKLERAGLVLKTRDGKSVRLQPVAFRPTLPAPALGPRASAVAATAG